MDQSKRKAPNIVFIMSDDHAAHAMSCYESVINETPNIDRIAKEGTRFDHCYCTNSICAPSRASILTGTYNHLNGVRTLSDRFDGRQTTFPKLLQQAGYQTAIVGKWHLGHGGESDPTGFDYWNILPGQGDYHDPILIEMGENKRHAGYVTDVITDLTIDWLGARDKDKPFLLMCHHKAPHRPWIPDEKHMHLYEDMDIPEPATFHDDYSDRARAASDALMRVDRDLTRTDLKMDPPEGLTDKERKSWNYQRYIKDYLRCVASIDDNVGRLLDYLDEQQLTEDTIVIYTSDQGFFLGDHGWYDKRFMYEESLKMPFVMRYPREIAPGSINKEMILNIDFGPTFLDYAGIEAPQEMQGRSMRCLARGEQLPDWRQAMYYRYWMHIDEHRVHAHYGIRTKQFKLIYYYADPLDTSSQSYEPIPPEWELFDLKKDPHELLNVYHDPDYEQVAALLTKQLQELQTEVQDTPYDGQ